MTATSEGAGGWTFAPEGAALRETDGLAVIADVHLGYEWARAAGGDVVPAHSLRETLDKLGRLLDRAPIDRLVVAGDLVESPRPCARTAADVARLVAWLRARGVALIALRGNHDPPARPAWPSTLEVEGWTIAHGHRPIAGPRRLIGHHHPVLKAAGLVASCILVGPSTIVLPAFSPNAAGLDVGRAALPPDPFGEPFRCLASSGVELLDFGPLADLRAKLIG